MTVGERIKQLRTEHELSQDELTKILKLKSRSNLATWETDKANPDYETLKKIASYFSVTVDYILGTTEDPKANGSMNFVLKNGMNINELAKMMDILDIEDQNKIIKAITGLNAMIELNKKSEGNK